MGRFLRLSRLPGNRPETELEGARGGLSANRKLGWRITSGLPVIRPESGLAEPCRERKRLITKVTECTGGIYGCITLELSRIPLRAANQTSSAL